MFFALTAVVAALFAQAALANPIAPAARPIGADRVDPSIATDFPVVDITSVAPKPNITVGANGVHTDVAQADFPASLLLFSGFSCSGTVDSINLASVPFDQCFFAPILFNSAAVSQPSNSGLDFAVLVGPDGCASFAQLPAVNTCFNLNGGPFGDFAIE